MASKARVVTHITAPMFQFAHTAAGAEAMTRMLVAARDDARNMTAPGIGPGPHPHITPHIDSGELQRSIDYDLHIGDSHQRGTVFADTRYAPHVEVGWADENGIIWQYPYLTPALMTQIALHTMELNLMELLRSRLNVAK